MPFSSVVELVGAEAVVKGNRSSHVGRVEFNSWGLGLPRIWMSALPVLNSKQLPIGTARLAYGANDA